MNVPEKFGGPVRLLAVFILLTAIAVAALGWIGWRSLQENETTQLRYRQQDAANLLAREFERELMGWEDLLSAAAQGKEVALPPGAALIVFDSQGIVSRQGVALPYYPHVPISPRPPDAVFAVAQAAEYREGDLDKAAKSYLELASTKDPRIRAEALMRAARCLRNQQRFKEALAVYGKLAAMGATPVAGDPSELVALGERIALLKTIGDTNAARIGAASLAAALTEGRYVIDRVTFDQYRESNGATLPEAPLTEATDGLWPKWEQEPQGRTLLTNDGGAVVSVWRRVPPVTVGIVAGMDVLAAPVERLAENLGVHLALEDAAGRTAWGSISAISNKPFLPATKALAGLPWSIQVTYADPVSGTPDAFRRNVMLAGFGLMVLVMTTASYFTFRGVSHDLQVARLQSDFVSAVSHEFRTPLTAMCHLTEMLEEGETPQERLPQYYRALGKEARRLHAMVESLLDFKRMEAGRRTYRMEDANAVELARSVVDEFRDDSSGHRIELAAPPSPAPIRADHEALGLALRNLMDNAIKYSPESTTVTVSVECNNGLTGISVQDEGVGIPKHEQRDVFRKFVRGSSAKNLQVKGTGIGLAMVAQIVEAHRGRIELISEPGHGSRFTILLPSLTNL
jgi:signal transduction histidine kinase